MHLLKTTGGWEFISPLLVRNVRGMIQQNLSGHPIPLGGLAPTAWPRVRDQCSGSAFILDRDRLWVCLFNVGFKKNNIIHDTLILRRRRLWSKKHIMSRFWRNNLFLYLDLSNYECLTTIWTSCDRGLSHSLNSIMFTNDFCRFSWVTHTMAF